jgi:hypothetical protein
MHHSQEAHFPPQEFLVLEEDLLVLLHMDDLNLLGLEILRVGLDILH